MTFDCAVLTLACLPLATKDSHKGILLMPVFPYIK